MSRPMRPPTAPVSIPLNRRQLLLAAAGLPLLASGSAALATQYPVTPQQRSTAQQVAQAGVPLSELAPDAPDSYTIKRGDTLWGIASLFLRTPWRWPELWGMNLEQIRNPHLIYPGQLLVLVKTDGTARLVMGRAVTDSLDEARTGRLRPRVRENALFDTAISAVPMHLIGPFLNEAAVFDTDQLAAAPRIVATQEGRVLLSRGETAFVRGDVSKHRSWQIFRQAKPLVDPDTRQILGYEGRHVGVAEVLELGDTSNADGEVIRASVMDITQLREEAGVGDRLAPLQPISKEAFVPHAPLIPVDGRIVSIYGDSINVGQNQIVVLNQGERNGLERGHVLGLWRTGATRVDTTSPDRASMRLPDERVGLLFVFRVFERVSYALIVQSQDPVRAGDRFGPP